MEDIFPKYGVPVTNAAPEMFLKEIGQVNLVITEGQDFEQRLVVVNKGKEQWPKTVHLKSVGGPIALYINVPPLAPQESHAIVIKHSAGLP